LEIASPHAALDNSSVDPKDRLFEYQRYLPSVHLARTGKVEEAAAEFADDDPKYQEASRGLAKPKGGKR